MKRTANQAEANKNKIVSLLKENLEARYARGDFNKKSQCAVMVASPAWPQGTGIRPELLGLNNKGEKTYSINCGQAIKFLERLGETPPPEEMKQ